MLEKMLNFFEYCNNKNWNLVTHFSNILNFNTFIVHNWFILYNNYNSNNIYYSFLVFIFFLLYYFLHFYERHKTKPIFSIWYPSKFSKEWSIWIKCFYCSPSQQILAVFVFFLKVPMLFLSNRLTDGLSWKRLMRCILKDKSFSHFIFIWNGI